GAPPVPERVHRLRLAVARRAVAGAGRAVAPVGAGAWRGRRREASLLGTGVGALRGRRLSVAAGRRGGRALGGLRFACSHSRSLSCFTKAALSLRSAELGSLSGSRSGEMAVEVHMRNMIYQTSS